MSSIRFLSSSAIFSTSWKRLLLFFGGMVVVDRAYVFLTCATRLSLLHLPPLMSRGVLVGSLETPVGRRRKERDTCGVKSDHSPVASSVFLLLIMFFSFHLSPCLFSILFSFLSIPLLSFFYPSLFFLSILHPSFFLFISLPSSLSCTLPSFLSFPFLSFLSIH